MITIKNRQRIVHLDIPFLKQTAQCMLKLLGYADFDLGMWFASETTIRRFNAQYRNKPHATDILSFPYHATQSEKRIIAQHEDDKNLGDLIIAPAYVQRQLKLYDVTLKDRLAMLLAHGLCHLIGYTHNIKSEDLKMRSLEQMLFNTCILKKRPQN